jgi:hypothetical protein
VGSYNYGAAARILWLDEVKDHDFTAALNYLSLLLDEDRASAAVHDLKRGKVVKRRANDVLRACRREPLSERDPGVVREAGKVTARRKLAPLLVVSFEDVGADIVDGYHRLSLAYSRDPFEAVPLVVASVSRHSTQLQLGVMVRRGGMGLPEARDQSRDKAGGLRCFARPDVRSGACSHTSPVIACMMCSLRTRATSVTGA